MTNWYIVQTFSGFEQKVAETLKETVKTKKLEDKITDVFTGFTRQISEDFKQRNKKNANYYNERLLRSFFDCFKSKKINFINGYFKEI